MSAPRDKESSRRWYGSGASKSRLDPLQPASAALDKQKQSGMSDAAWLITSRMMAGILLYAGLGWLISRWVGHADLLIAGGALIGLGLSMFLVIRQLGGVHTDARRPAKRQASAPNDQAPTDTDPTTRPGGRG